LQKNAQPKQSSAASVARFSYNLEKGVTNKKCFNYTKKQKETFTEQKQKNKTKNRTKRLILCLVLFIMRL
jgi:uncharacterized ion transporter superfamily protein YfcC